MDVPAIIVMVPAPNPCNIMPPNQGGWVDAVCITGPEEHETCADKSRILMYSEDGTAHCMKFEGQRPNVSVPVSQWTNGITRLTGTTSDSVLIQF